MKEAVFVMSTDWHLKRENIDQIIGLVQQQCELAVELKCNTLVCLGDVFDSRISQRLDVLNAFNRILNMIHLDYGMKIIIIPGNHDKTQYDSKESFLDPYESHPGIELIREHFYYHNDGEFVYEFIPFFKEDVWMEEFKKSTFSGKLKHILFTHIATTGSKNNDGTIVEAGTTIKTFENHFKVFSGHYHDQQKIGNFYHIPSIQQNNYGEDSDKGFTVLFGDGSHELVKSDFKEYIKVQVDLDTCSDKDLKLLKAKHKMSDNNIRFEIKGSENKVKALDKQQFYDLGIDVTSKIKEIEEEAVSEKVEEFVEFSKDSIIEEFNSFCEKENLDKNVGIKYLKLKL